MASAVDREIDKLACKLLTLLLRRSSIDLERAQRLMCHQERDADYAADDEDY